MLKTTKELLAELEVSEERLRHAIRKGELNPERLGAIPVWPPSEVERARALFAQKERRGRGPAPEPVLIRCDTSGTEDSR